MSCEVIRQARRLGFSIEQVGGLLSLWSQRDRSSREVKALAQQHLQELEDKLQELQTMKLALQQLVHACAGDEHAHCAILDGLAVASPSAPSTSAATAHEPSPWLSATSSSVARRRPRPGDRNEIASRQLVLPAPFGPTSATTSPRACTVAAR